MTTHDRRCAAIDVPCDRLSARFWVQFRPAVGLNRAQFGGWWRVSARSGQARTLAADDGREEHGEEEGGPVEDVVDPARHTCQLQTGDAEREEEDGHDRADDVEPAGLDGGGAEV